MMTRDAPTKDAQMNMAAYAPPKVMMVMVEKQKAFCFSTITIITFGGAYAAMFIWASLVGASRVIIGVHYPGDIVAGAVMGSGIAVGTASMLNIW